MICSSQEHRVLLPSLPHHHASVLPVFCKDDEERPTPIKWELISLLLRWDPLSGDVCVYLLTVLKWVSREGKLDCFTCKGTRESTISWRGSEDFLLWHLSWKIYFSYAVCTHHHVLRVSVTLWFYLHLKYLFTLLISSVICLSPSSPPFPMKQSVHLLSSRGQGCINTSFFTHVLPISILSFSIDISSILSMSVPKYTVIITLSLVPVLVPDVVLSWKICRSQNHLRGEWRRKWLYLFENVK